MNGKSEHEAGGVKIVVNAGKLGQPVLIVADDVGLASVALGTIILQRKK